MWLLYDIRYILLMWNGYNADSQVLLHAVGLPIMHDSYNLNIQGSSYSRSPKSPFPYPSNLSAVGGHTNNS